MSNKDWISVKDRLPNGRVYEEQFVLASTTDGNVEFIYYDESNKRWRDTDGFTFYVTHWQPLPKAFIK